MANTQHNEQATTQPSQPHLQIQRLYVKEQHCKLPYAPQIFTEQETQLDNQLELNIKHQQLQADIYEVVLQINVVGKAKGRTAFQIEIQQAGIFELKGMDDEQRQTMLDVDCPSQLFPYARKTIADLTLAGSLPALTLAPINFDAIYQQQASQQETAGQTEEVTDTEV